MDAILPDASTELGERIRRRLSEEFVVWLTTVGSDGTPQPNPVWFLWDGDTILVYSMNNAARERNIERNPRVSLNLNSTRGGGHVVVSTGEARISPEEPSADNNPAYVEKYNDMIAGSFGTPEQFASEYSVPIRITPTKVRGG